MFDLFRSTGAKRRAAAKDLISHAGKVLRYRRDILSAAAVAEIESASAALKAVDVSSESGYTAAHDALADALTRHGGRIFPLGTVTDWVETFVIAAILAGGIRVYVFQPFKIPTNSMWPTYHGMTAKVYAPDEASPSALGRAMRKVTLGATHYAPVAPVDGEILIPQTEPVRATDSGLFGLGILPGPALAHSLLVGTPESYKSVTVTLPADFQFASPLFAAFFPKEYALPIPERDRLDAALAKASAAGDRIRLADGTYALRTHRRVKAGEPLMRFDLLTGDMVIVDRMSYHFRKPSVGDAFVFRTREVPNMAPMDQFYIKRLVAQGGDTLRVADGKLWRNGAPAAGNAGFDNNNAHATDKGYFGYLADIGGPYALDETVTIPAGHYWAMGDNSGNSRDSRYFGPVREKAVVGRAIFVLHPFTERTGVAR